MKTCVVIVSFYILCFHVIQQNHAPEIKILSPQAQSSFSLGSRVHYSIAIKDKEDGDSHFDEINPKEVLLKVLYIRNDKSLRRELKALPTDDPPGLTDLRTSNCLNCHAFGVKLTAPSFTEICKKYEKYAATDRSMGKSISKGSVNVWGSTPMPAHPELNDSAIQNMVKFILQLSKNPDAQYYVGTEGQFIFPNQRHESKKDMFILVASYLDHGVGNNKERIRGNDAVVIFRNR
jgi:cytochrome c